MSAIVWAEDSPVDQMLITAALEGRAAPSVAFAEDGSEVIGVAEREHPTLIVLDMKMPRLDGLEALRRIRDHPTLGHTSVILFSSSFLPQDVQAAHTLRADYIQKPLTFDEFRQTVRAITDRCHAESVPAA